MDVSKIFDRKPLVPRVEIPGVDREEVAALRESMEFTARQRAGYLSAMLALGKPIARRPKKRARRTAHVRRMEALAARSTKRSLA